MTETIWIHQARPRTSWYALSPAEKHDLRTQWKALDEAASATGAEKLGEYSIRGQSDYSTVELWRFTGPEKAFEFWDDRVRADYAVWFAFSNQLGVEAGPDGGEES